MIFFLTTFHGSLVCVDAATGLLCHRPIGTAPANLIAERDGAAIVLHHLDPAGCRQPIALGAERCGIGQPGLSPRRLAERHRNGRRAALTADGYFLSAEPDGKISFWRSIALDHETFLQLTADQRDDFCTLMAGRWVTGSARRLLLPEEQICLPGFAVRLRQSDHEIEPLLDQLRPHGAEPLATSGRLALRTEGWRLDWLHLFRPLAYLTLFGGDDDAACALATIESLLRLGDWPGDILVITDAAHADFRQTLPPDLAARTKRAVIQADDPMDRAFARYRIADLAEAQGYQPILYLDADIICDAPLTGLLVGLATSDRLHTMPERRLLDADESYGRSLFLRDGYADQGDAIGFSCCLLGFRSVRDIREPFDAIIACGYGFAEQEQSREFFPTHGQAFANYVMQKIGVFDLSLIYACQSKPGERRGLMRFPGSAGGRAAAMQAYAEGLGSIPVTDQP